MASPSLHATKGWFLWSLSIVYLFGFTSLFVQIPGLFGRKGISPAELSISKDVESIGDFITNKPTLLRLLPKIGLDLDLGLDFLCVGGLIASFVSIISKDHRNALVACLQWLFYLSIVQVGHVFLSYKWDNLLLEVGFLAIFLSPLGIFGLHDNDHDAVIQNKSRPHRRHVSQQRHHGNERLVIWLVRWVLFRLVLAESLTGLDDIFGSEEGRSLFTEAVHNLVHLHNNILIPTPATWLLGYLPASLVAMVIGMYLLSGLVVCVLVVLPSRRLHRVAFLWMLLTTAARIIVSNQGFYPLLLITVSFSLLDDDWFAYWGRYFSRKFCKTCNPTCSTDTAPLNDHHHNNQPHHPKSNMTSLDAATSSVTSNSDAASKKPKEVRKGTVSVLKSALKVAAGFAFVAGILVLYGFPSMTGSTGGGEEEEGSDDDDGGGGDDDGGHVSFLVSALVVILETVHNLTGLQILVSLLVAGTSLFFECAVAIKRQWSKEIIGQWSKSVNHFRSLSLCALIISLFAISLVPLTWYDGQESGRYLPSELQQAYLWTHKQYRMVNNYVTASKRVEINGSQVGRLEVVLEGSQTLEDGDWLEYSFRYKPGHVDVAPPLVAPHHPRLDETMHYASRDSYSEHHWILNLVYRLLSNQQEVLELMDNNPFPDGPPKYIKASIYEYKFNINGDKHDDDGDGGDDGSDEAADNVGSGDDNDDGGDGDKTSPSSAWWSRKWLGYYLPVVSTEDPEYSEYLQLSGIIKVEDTPKESGCKQTNVLGSFLYFVRSLLGQSNGSCLCLVLISLAFLLAYVDLSSSSSSSPSSSLSPPTANQRGKSPRRSPQPSGRADGGFRAQGHDHGKVINVPIQYVDKTRK